LESETAPLKLAVDAPLLTSELNALAQFSEHEPTGLPAETAVTRVVFGEADRRARAYVESLALAAGLAIRHDPAGNTFFRWQGTEPALPAIATGSHIDAIPNAGMYDGTVGVLGGIAALRALKAAGFVPRRSIDVILFTSEEPTRFGIGCLGSRLLSGTLSLWDAVKLRDPEGRTLDQLRLAAGFTGQLEDVQLNPGTYAHFVELHIEQGPILEAEAQPIGVVTAIAAPASLRLEIQGEGGHAGAMLMPVRHDALVAAAEIIQAVERAALATRAPDTVATIGICDVFPGAVNSVPSRVRLSLDVRDIDHDRRDRVLAAIAAASDDVALRRGVQVTRKTLNADAPCTCDPAVIAAIEAACASQGFPARPMVSRAYHDTLFMSRICPVGMIFIPCKAGVSHRPDEFSTPAQIATGVTVLARTLAELSAET
jgi:ureidoglycolate amidohydrolase